MFAGCAYRADMPLPASPAPFVLIDDARDTDARPARLYRDPVEIVAAYRLADVQGALERLRSAQEAGLHAAGFLSYEAGFAFEPHLSRLLPDAGEAGAPPLLWFGLFEECQAIDAAEVASLLPQNGIATGGALHSMMDKADYARAFERVQELIRAGDIYQANLSLPCEIMVPDDVPAFYADVRARAKAGHGALVMTGEHWLLSFSPELFFMAKDGLVTTRPMKGTALRSEDALRDAASAVTLQTDPKQRAENLMIVDLLRNDLSRVAQPGSVQVPHLFAVESYPTVHQMTSTVTARLRTGVSAVDVLRALFPCGSITGAPKLRAMEVIHDIEQRHRGPYTGSIGALGADGSAEFNVAIRTVCVKYGDRIGTIGLGSGVVADSDAQSEWDECLDKGRFLGPIAART
ncbi:MAG: aminodeoxychorismate synthase component I [Sphingobium sp.]